MSKEIRILVIDEEIQIRKLLRIILSSQGYQVREAVCGRDGLDEAAAYRPDLIISGLGLPDMDGFGFIRRLREWSKVPVITMAEKDQENDVILVLDTGADDFIAKPFGTGEMLARIRVALRHNAGVKEPLLSFGEITIDLDYRRVKVAEKEIKLSPLEYDLIKILAVHDGKTVPCSYLLQTVWGLSHKKDTDYLRVFIRHLRQKIEADPSRPCHIITEPGVGYRLT